jgi:hypothetical protein
MALAMLAGDTAGAAAGCAGRVWGATAAVGEALALMENACLLGLDTM